MNLVEIDTLRESENLSRLNQQEVDDINIPINIKEVKTVLKKVYPQIRSWGYINLLESSSKPSKKSSPNFHPTQTLPEC